MCLLKEVSLKQLSDTPCILNLNEINKRHYLFQKTKKLEKFLTEHLYNEIVSFFPKISKKYFIIEQKCDFCIEYILWNSNIIEDGRELKHHCRNKILDTDRCPNWIENSYNYHDSMFIEGENYDYQILLIECDELYFKSEKYSNNKNKVSSFDLYFEEMKNTL